MVTVGPDPVGVCTDCRESQGIAEGLYLYIVSGIKNQAVGNLSTKSSPSIDKPRNTVAERSVSGISDPEQ